MGDELVILYEDNHCLALAKPAALLTQGVPPGIPTLEAMAKEYLKQRYNKKGNVYLGIPHRLDRPVSGVVLFARSTKAAQRLAEQFQARTVRKIYWALLDHDLAGQGPPESGTWEDWLRKLQEQSRAEVVSPDSPDAKPARLHFRRLARLPENTLVEIELETGRMHQIRVQAASRGWPVRGDQYYGSHSQFGPPAELTRDRAIALHGRSLTFLHPIRFEPVTVVAPLPSLWKLYLGEQWGQLA